jgi:hypothetical protein
MSVYDLNEEQLMQLKNEMYYGTDDFVPLYNKYDYSDDIPFEKSC